MGVYPLLQFVVKTTSLLRLHQPTYLFLLTSLIDLHPFLYLGSPETIVKVLNIKIAMR